MLSVVFWTNMREEEQRRIEGISEVTGDASSAVDQSKDHASKGPGNSLDADGGALAVGLDHPHDGKDGDVEEEEGGHELCDSSPVEGP